MNIAIISQNGYHINEYMADMLVRAIAPLDHNINRGFRSGDTWTDLILMTNGMGLSDEARDAYASGIPIILFHDELQSTIVPVPQLIVASQYFSHGDKHFPVARLALFDDRWEHKQKILKLYEFVYWGKPKAGRDELYETFPDGDDCLYISGWNDRKPNSHQAPHCNDRDALLNIIATGKRTNVNGSRYDDEFGNEPLRIFEALMLDVIPDKVGFPFKDYDTAYSFYIGDLGIAREGVTKMLEALING